MAPWIDNERSCNVLKAFVPYMRQNSQEMTSAHVLAVPICQAQLWCSPSAASLGRLRRNKPQCSAHSNIPASRKSHTSSCSGATKAGPWRITVCPRVHWPPLQQSMSSVDTSQNQTSNTEEIYIYITTICRVLPVSCTDMEGDALELIWEILYAIWEYSVYFVQKLLFW